MVGYLFDRLKRAPALDGIVLATSDDPADDAVAAFAQMEGIALFRGPLNDVASRILGAADAAGATAFLRVSGDSPLLDPAIVNRAIALFRTQRPDIVSNVVKRTFPKGQSVEIVDTETFRNAAGSFETAADREHVTPYFYRHCDRYRIVGFERAMSAGQVQLSVDTETDFRRFETLVGQMTRPHWDYGLDEILDLLAAANVDLPE